VWEVDLARGFAAPHPDYRSYQELGLILQVRAYMRAFDGDPAAWDELHAAWQLARHLQARPEVESQWTAMGIARGVNAASWKMPLPPPAWLDELRQTDYQRLAFRAARVEAFTMHTYGESPVPPLRLMGRYLVMRGIEAGRLATHDIAQAKACDVDMAMLLQKRYEGSLRFIQGRALSSSNAWQQMLLFRVEREAAANALRAAAGAPIVTQSACTDGTWSIVDGHVTFNGRVSEKYSPWLTLPLSLAVRRAQ
jgi:hypothetical protein